MLLVFCPNLIMFFAFIFWGVSEGSVNEMISCCALYFLRPLTLLWAAPYINDFKDKIKTLILKCSYVAEYCLLAAVSYSVLLTSTWERILNYADFDKVVIIILYVILFLSCFCKFSNISASQIGNGKGRINDILDIVADLTFEILPTLKCVILFYTFASSGGGLVAIAVLLVLLLMANERTFYKCGRLGWSWPIIRTVWLLVIIILNIVMIGLYIFTLENETDYIGWVCVMLFLQILWTVVRFTDQTYYTFALDFHRFVTLYVFGSVGVLLISAAALMTELILKTVSGERVMMDMRFIVFPSECVFILSVMILGQLASAGILRMSDGFIIKGSSGPLVVPLGGSVVLPCSVDSLLSLEDLEVEWRRSDSQTLIHLYQDEDIRPQAQHQDYHDRAHFFTEDIKHGNFSLLLNNLTAEDDGQYTCKVYSGQESGETVVEIKHAERLIVSGSSRSISASVGDDVTLSCSVNSHIKPEEIEEVSWKKTNKGEPITVLLYQYNEILSDASDERYRDRVEFFTDEIHRGNFSLRLKRVTTEDKGVYICQVFTGRLSANTTVIIGQIGFSGLHIMVLILCITACGSAVIISSLIYCTSSNKILCLQVLLVFCPNTILFFAFMLWGFIEGSMHESVSCSTVYIVRPLMLFWAAPYLKDFPDIIRRWIDSSSIDVQVSIFTVLFYSIYDTWTRNQKSADADQILIAVLFVLMLLLCLIKIIKGLANMIMDKKSTNIQIRERINYVLQGWDLLSCRVLPLLQFTLLFYSFGVAKRAFFVTGALPLIVMLSDKEWYLTCFKSFSAWLGKTVRLIIMIVVNAALFPLMYLYFKSLENEKDRFALAWMVGLFQVLSMIQFSFDYLEFPRCNSLYLFGAVGLVLVNSIGLMTELILQKVNGERAVGDLRMVVFPSECLFILIGMTVEIFTFLRSIKTQIEQEKMKTDGYRHKQKTKITADVCEMDPLPAFESDLINSL